MNKMIKLLNTVKIILCGLLVWGAGSGLAAAEPVKKIFISQFATHPALDNTTRGIIDGLALAGERLGLQWDVRVESAQGNPTLAAQIAAKFVNQEADLVVGVATIAAQSFAKYAQDNKTHLVFSSVTDPLKAGLVQTLNKPGNNTSGVSNFVALKPQLELFQQLQPNLNRLGFIYNPSEINSQVLLTQLQALSAEMHLQIVPQSAYRTADISQAVTKLVQSVDAIFISNDSTALSALPLIVKIAHNAKVPVYVSDIDAMNSGALAALGPSQYVIGQQTAQIVARYFQGEDLGLIPVEFPLHTELHLNLKAAQLLGLSIAQDCIDRASQIIS